MFQKAERIIGAVAFALLLILITVTWMSVQSTVVLHRDGRFKSDNAIGATANAVELVDGYLVYMTFLGFVSTITFTLLYYRLGQIRDLLQEQLRQTSPPPAPPPVKLMPDFEAACPNCSHRVKVKGGLAKPEDTLAQKTVSCPRCKMKFAPYAHKVT